MHRHRNFPHFAWVHCKRSQQKGAKRDRARDTKNTLIISAAARVDLLGCSKSLSLKRASLVAGNEIRTLRKCTARAVQLHYLCNA